MHFLVCNVHFWDIGQVISYCLVLQAGYGALVLQHLWITTEVSYCFILLDLKQAKMAESKQA